MEKQMYDKERMEFRDEIRCDHHWSSRIPLDAPRLKITHLFSILRWGAAHVFAEELVEIAAGIKADSRCQIRNGI